MSGIVSVTIFVPSYINARVVAFFMNISNIHKISLADLQNRK